MKTTLETALHWWQRSQVCIPVHERSKIAAIEWKVWQKRIPERADLVKWFGKNDKNIGLVLGRGRLCVLDFDSMPKYHKWYDTFPGIFRTYKVETPRPGMHCYYYVNDMPASGTTDFGEIKAFGTYILIPPSVHPSGKRYFVGRYHPIMEVERLPEELYCLDSGKVMPQSSHRPDNLGCATNKIRVPKDGSLYKGVIRDIKAGLSILDLVSRYTEMKPSNNGNGRWFLGRCPYPDHEDKHPSFRVDAQANRANCFSGDCRLHDARAIDQVEFFSRLHHLNYKDSCKILAKELKLV